MGCSRQEYWGGLPFSSPGYTPNPETEHIFCIERLIWNNFYQKQLSAGEQEGDRVISAGILFGTFQVQPTYWKKTRPGEFEWFVQEGFAVWLLREARAPGYPVSQTNILSASDTSAFCWTFPSLCSWLSWEEQIWLSLCQNQGDGFSLLLYIFTSFKVRTACITYLVGILVIPVVMFSQAHLYAGLGLQEGLEPGTWLEPLGWTRDLDLGYIPILIPKWYWKEYSVTQALSRMIEHLAYVPTLRPAMCTCYNRGAHLFQHQPFIL